MTNPGSFMQWCAEQIGSAATSEMSIAAAFEIAVSRIEHAARAGAKDPVAVVGNSSSSGSRQATRSMLIQLGYTDGQSRVVQRLLAGSPGGWPGLIRLYVTGDSLPQEQRSYVQRQVRRFRALEGAPEIRVSEAA